MKLVVLTSWLYLPPLGPTGSLSDTSPASPCQPLPITSLSQWILPGDRAPLSPLT